MIIIDYKENTIDKIKLSRS